MATKKLPPKKDVVPASDDVANQSNVLSRSSYSMPVVQRRLLFLAMAQVRNDDPARAFRMRVADVLKALGMSDDRYREIRSEVRKLFDNNKVEVETPRGWRFFTWVTDAEYEDTDDDGNPLPEHYLTITLHERILPFARTLQRHFHQFQITQIARLQGRHALRIFEILASFADLAGKGGNKPGCWYWETTVEELRHLMKIGPNEYKQTNSFRLKVVDTPIQEINEAGLGMTVKVEYKRVGKRLTGFRFECTVAAKDEPKPAKPAPATASQREDDAWVELNQKLYAQLEEREFEAPSDLGLDSRPVPVRALEALKNHPKAVKPKAPKGGWTA